MLPILIYSLIIILALVVGILITVYAFQEKLIFYPEKLHKTYQFSFDIPFKEFFIEVNKKVALNAILFETSEPKGLIYYHHGNSGNIQLWGNLASYYTMRGWDVLMYDFRGFGKSTGEIKNARMMFNDADKVYHWALKYYDEKDIILWGRSMGTGIVAKLATQYKTKFLMLETPYYSFYDVAKFHYPYLPTSLLLNYHFKTFKYLRKINEKIYLIHGTRDKTVPYNSSERLMKENEETTLFTIEGAGHIDFDAYDYYQEILDKILGNLIK